MVGVVTAEKNNDCKYLDLAHDVIAMWAWLLLDGWLKGVMQKAVTCCSEVLDFSLGPAPLLFPIAP